LSLIFLSVDGVILYGELLLKKSAIYGVEKVGLKLHKEIYHSSKSIKGRGPKKKGQTKPKY
jgi:hypothetical protein